MVNIAPIAALNVAIAALNAANIARRNNRRGNGGRGVLSGEDIKRNEEYKENEGSL